MLIRYLGHAGVQITQNNSSLIIDPWITGNPLARTMLRSIKVRYVLLTHGHSDHIADAVKIAKRNNATVIAVYELAEYLRWKGVKVFPMNIGGSRKFPFGTVKLTQALHSSSVIKEKRKRIIYAGSAAGFLIRIGGKTIYHAGDTGLFGDMQKVIGDRNAIDLAFLPIGNVYTMGPRDALQAAKWTRAKLVVPIHYQTFPEIRQDVNQFIRLLQANHIPGIALRPGQTLSM